MDLDKCNEVIKKINTLKQDRLIKDLPISCKSPRHKTTKAQVKKHEYIKKSAQPRGTARPVTHHMGPITKLENELSALGSTKYTRHEAPNRACDGGANGYNTIDVFSGVRMPHI